MTQKEQENLGYTIEAPKRGSKIVNVIAPLILLASFVIGVGYASIALMGNKNDNYLEKVEQMKKEKKKTETSEAAILIDETL